MSYKSQTQGELLYNIKNNMKPNLTIADKKKTIIEIIVQLGVDQQKIQRKSEIVACLQLPTAAQDPVGFKDKLADWLITNSLDFKTNPQLFLQCGNLKYLTKETREILVALFKKCQDTLGDSTDYSDLYHSYMMKNPFIGYQHMGYMYPPYMMGPAYPSANDRQGYQNYQKMYNMDMQQYYMQMAKYGYSQMYMPPMPMPVPKYTGTQTSEMVMKNPYYPYPMMQPPPMSLNPQTYPAPPQQIQTPSQMPASTPLSLPSTVSLSKPKPQSPVQLSPTGPKLRTSQLAPSRQSAKQLNFAHDVQQNQKHNSYIAKNVLRERSKKIGPFIIITPNMQKIQREQIPQRLYPSQNVQHNVGNSQIEVNNSNSDIQIVQKIPNQSYTPSQPIKLTKPAKPKKLLANPNSLHHHNHNNNHNGQQNLISSALGDRNYENNIRKQELNKTRMHILEMHGYNSHNNSNNNNSHHHQGGTTNNTYVKNCIQFGLEFREQLKYCLCKGYGIYEDVYTCADCGKKYHYYCTEKKFINKKQLNQNKNQKNAQDKAQQQSKSSKNDIICHFCFMKNIDPLNKAQKQIKILYIVDIKRTKINQLIDFQQYDSFHNKNSPYQIQARCMRLQDAANMNPEYTWPDQCLVMLNQEKTIQFQALQHNSSLKKRKDMSIFLTSYIYSYNRNWAVRKNLPVGLEIKDNTPTQISQKKIRNNYVFVFGLYLIKKKTPQQLLQQILKDPTNKVNYAQKFFSEQIPEDQIQIQQIKVTLMDPFTWNLIDVPARGRKCIHGQCFDLKTFLSFMNVQKFRQWRCPVCNKQCRNFYIDVQQLQVIKQFKKHQNQGSNKKFSKQIEFHRDGRTLFVAQNDDDQGEDDRNNNSTEFNKTKLIVKQSKDSKQMS